EGGPVGGLLPALAGYPGAAPRERTRQWLHVANAAAGASEFEAFIKGVFAMRSHMLAHRVGLWPHHYAVDTVAFSYARNERKGFPMQPARVERKDMYRYFSFGDGVRQHHVFGCEGRGQKNVRMTPGGVFQRVDQTLPQHVLPLAK